MGSWGKCCQMSNHRGTVADLRAQGPPGGRDRCDRCVWMWGFQIKQAEVLGRHQRRLRLTSFGVHLRPKSARASGSAVPSLSISIARSSEQPSTRRSLNSGAAAGRPSNMAAAAAGEDESTKQQLLQLSRQLLTSIAQRDWGTYSQLCDDNLTCFEPEAVGHLVEGLPFHQFYFDLLLARGTSYQAPTNTISQPHVRLLGSDAAVVSYIRLQQKMDTSSGRPVTVATEETRVWERRGGKWRNVHFHRSPTTPSG